MSLYPEGKKKDQYHKLAKYFTEFLKKQPEDSKVTKYLERRGINGKAIDKFEIGYCKKDLSLPKYLERMHGRIIFPIADEYGDIVAFSGRLPMEKHEVPEGEKHWFHESFPKSFFLYGLNVAWPHILKNNHVFIVEGQTDVITMHQFGFLNTVGVLGSALVTENVAKLARFTNRFVTIFDSDEGGRKAGIRTSEFLADYSDDYDHIDVNLRTKAKNYDPDEFLKKFGSKKMVKRIKRSIENKKENEDTFVQTILT